MFRFCYSLANLKWMRLCHLLLFYSCGSGNIFTCPSTYAGAQCSEKSGVERAKDALDASDPVLAISILEEEIAKLADDDYSLTPLLASAYAQKAGVDIFNITSVSTSGGQDALSLIGEFLPSTNDYTSDEYDLLLEAIAIANEKLDVIPADYKDAVGREAYASAVYFQSSLYTAASAVMILNQFLSPDLTDPSQWDQDRLAEMTDAEAEAILGYLENAAAQSGDQNVIASKVGTTVSKIEATEGETTRDKLINYSNTRR